MTKTPLTLLGLGAMGAALAESWLADDHPLTAWNRTPARTEALAGRASVAGTAADAVAANRLVVLCLLDDASITEALDGVDLTGKDVVNLTTGTPAEARARAGWARERGARYLDGGIMAVPPMIGVPDSGGYVFYSGSPDLFEEHGATLAVPAGARYVGEDAGFAALHDLGLLSAMYGMFAGVTHAFALIRGEDVSPAAFGVLLAEWLTAMGPHAVETGKRLESGDHTTGVVSNLAMQAAGIPAFLGTAEAQGVSPELLAPFFSLVRRHVAAGHGDEDGAGLVDRLRAG